MTSHHFEYSVKTPFQVSQNISKEEFNRGKYGNNNDKKTDSGDIKHHG